MKERGILFSAPMVRAILDGRKTQTRRLITGLAATAGTPYWPGCKHHGDFLRVEHCPHGVAGDRLWVRETWREGADVGSSTVFYRADEDYHDGAGWKPSIFMPRWASRITLEVTDVRVERLQDITEEDIAAEGVTRESVEALVGRDVSDPLGCSPVGLWSLGWNAINGQRAPWASNPWVWAISFRRVMP